MASVAGGRRLIAVIALLCQLAAAAHVPLLHDSAAGHAETALEHCAGGGSHNTTLSPDHFSHPGRAGSCGCGLCQCTCAQAAALICALLTGSVAVHLPVMIGYRLPDVPQPATVFFRPPI
jgi:hypothetical protein